MFTPYDLQTLLGALGQTEAVIVGGQAVNLWSIRYQKDEPPWRGAQPFMSRDVDALGTLSDLRRCAAQLRAEVYLPETPPEETFNTGTLVVRVGDQAVEIDLLKEVKGLNSQEVRQTAVTLELHGNPVRVLHPVLCLESKTVSLTRIRQEGQSRQDLKHVELSLANTREFLADKTADPANLKGLLAWARRIRQLANDQLGLEARQRWRIDFQQAIPAQFWREQTGALRVFVEQEMPAWEQAVREKIRDLEEIQEWVKQLKGQLPRP
jgi:hypothetical protein